MEVIENDGTVIERANNHTVYRFPSRTVLTLRANPRKTEKLNISGSYIETAIGSYRELEAATAKLNADDSWSDAGKGRQLAKPRADAINTMAALWENLAVEEAHWAKQEASIYSVPALEPGDIVGAAQDREIRDWLRTLSSDERSKVLGELGRGDHERMAVALMRSPIPLGLEEKVAREAWKSSKDKADPQGIAVIHEEQASVDWARRHLKILGYFTQRTAAFNEEQVADVLIAQAIKQERERPQGFEVFGIHATSMERLVRLRASRFRAAA